MKVPPESTCFVVVIGSFPVCLFFSDSFGEGAHEVYPRLFITLILLFLPPVLALEGLLRYLSVFFWTKERG